MISNMLILLLSLARVIKSLNVDLGSIKLSNGAEVMGAADDDESGWSVSDAGDVNGDGYDDVIIGARNADVLDRVNAGCTYVLFGRRDGLPNIDLSSLRTSQGFKVMGASANDQSGWAVSSAGDVNGDGYDDVIIGAPNVDVNGHGDAGAAYIIFGKQNGHFNIDLASLSGVEGVMIAGHRANDKFGNAVGGNFDFNNDDLGEVVIGARLASPDGRHNAGAAYVILGRTSFDDVIDVSTLTVSDGFIIKGAETDDQTGISVSGAGDVNGDGYDDVIIGAFHADPLGRNKAGSACVVFGTSRIQTVDMLHLHPSQASAILGAHSDDKCGRSVSGAGDVNGDGYDDIIIGAVFADPLDRTNAGISYILFGRAGFTGVDLLDLSGVEGIKILGGMAYDKSGVSVRYAGDVNDDGYADVLVGTDSSGKIIVDYYYYGDDTPANTGFSYLLYGKPDLQDIDLAVLPITQGISFSGAALEDRAGRAVSGAGDVNGDGYADIIVGAFLGSPDGRTHGGCSYLIISDSPPTVVFGGGGGRSDSDGDSKDDGKFDDRTGSNREHVGDKPSKPKHSPKHGGKHGKQGRRHQHKSKHGPFLRGEATL